MQARNTYDRSAILSGYAPTSVFAQKPAVIPEHDQWDDDLDDEDYQELGQESPQVLILPSSSTKIIRCKLWRHLKPLCRSLLCCHG
jgi:hypothetical protein